MAPRIGAAVTVGTLLLSLTMPAIHAHKPITSTYTYNKNVFPILRDRCGRCHFEGGAAPMSLLTYKDAVPWAESMRQELIARRMPPWFVDPASPPIRDAHTISARELDTLITWATGGTPEGDPSTRPAAVERPMTWQLGLPGLTISTDTHTLGPSTLEETVAFVLPTTLDETRWIRATDILPGTPSMVREATIAVEGGPMLAVWTPGDDATPAPSGSAFRLPAGAPLRVRIHYKKRWQDEQIARSDRTTIGLYFAHPPTPHEIQTLTIERPTAGAEAAEPMTFATTLAHTARVLACTPTLNQAYSTIDVHARLPGGQRVSLLHLQAAQPQWQRRYWLVEPVDLPIHTTLEVSATPQANESAGRRQAAEPFRVAVDVVFK